MKYNICAIITAYYPDKSILKNIAMLEEQVAIIVVTDNTPDIDNLELFKHFAKVVYQANKSNLGLSVAFNNCLKLEIVKNSDFILFLDQDSFVPNNLVKILIADYNALLREKTNIGCIGPIYLEENAGKIMVPKIKYSLLPHIYRVDTIITSSMLTTYNALSAIDFWNEEIFLDLADWDLCFRFNKQGLCCCLTEKVLLKHRLGKSVKRFFGIIIKYSASVRIYYQIRDGLKLLLKNYTPVRYKIRFLLNVFFRPILHFIFFDQKLKRIKYLYLGIIDFLCFKCGALEAQKPS